MQPGAITQQIDVAQLALIAFFLFFLALVYYLRREDKREGYPLDEPGPQMHHGRLIGFPEQPPVKTLHLLEGGTTELPHYYAEPPAHGRYTDRFGGASIEPIGNPLLSGLGPATWVMRPEEPFRLADGELQLVPIREREEWRVREGEADPRGMAVFDARWNRVGTVVDFWVDRSAKILRYLEVELGYEAAPVHSTPVHSGPVHSDPGRRVLLPIFYADIKLKAREIRVVALRSWQFADIPALAHADRITAREEDQVNAYYAGGLFHGATAAMRAKP